MDGWAYQVRQGGLMRCCLKSLDEALKALLDAGQPQPEVGSRICCLYHESFMIRAQDGAWEWDHE